MLADGMPDLNKIHREDTGCRYAPKCLSCPFPQCVHDGYDVIRQTSIASWDAERMAIITSEKLTRAQAADRFGITKRTVFRIQARSKEE